MIEQVAFFVLAALTLLAAVGVVTSRSVFLSALWLIGSFVGVAGLYILLDAGFMAMIQIMVYVGAIAVLILFAVMLTRDVMSEDRPTGAQWVLGLIVALSLFGVLAVLGYSANWPIQQAQVVPAAGGVVVLDDTMTRDRAKTIESVVAEEDDSGATTVYMVPSTVAALGHTFMTTYLLPFEIIGAILLVALVGAVVIARE